jgi:hypothetical protein
MKTIIAFTAIAVALLSVGFTTTSTIRAQSNATASQPQQIPFLPTSVFQDDKQIVTIVTKSGQAPTGPVVVIPNPEGGKNGTILTPGDNKTAENGNITIIQPNGNITTVPGGNVTVVDNNTVVVAPPDRNVTTTPGNVTVIDPPAPTPVKNETGNGSSNHTNTCTCQQNQSNGSSIPPVQVIPAPGQDVTVNSGGNNNGSGNQSNVVPNQTNNNTTTNPMNPPLKQPDNNTTNSTPPMVPNNGTNGNAKNGTAGTTNLTVPSSMFPSVSKVALSSNNKVIGS